MSGLTLFIWEFGHTAYSLLSACRDWFVLRTPFAWHVNRQRTFAFLVHPRTDNFLERDVYGYNDIYRPFPVFRHFFKVMPDSWARKCIDWFARSIVPITLSRIQVIVNGRSVRGYLLSTVRTPKILLQTAPDETREHLADLFWLAAKKGVRRVGLGALLPSMTKYGKRFVGEPIFDRPAVSTGHAYTAYVIVELLSFIAAQRNAQDQAITVAIVGAAGSTGKAILKVLKRCWKGSQHLDLLLIDVPQKELALRILEKEMFPGSMVLSVRSATDPMTLNDAQYVAVVTNASGTVVKPDHVRPGTVIIDDSQPRNTSPELVEHGCHVIDVLARVQGLDCHFDFGFRTFDKTVTFTCLAETVLATVVGEINDLAVGEVTDDVIERTIKIIEEGRLLGLIGPPPFFSFGRELSFDERESMLQPAITIAPAAE